MTPLIYFLLSTVGGLLLVMAYVFKTPTNVITYFKTQNGKGALAGIVTFLGVGLLIGILSFAANRTEAADLRYFNYAEVFMGLEATKNISPQCDDYGPNNRITSNGGVRLNLAESTDRYSRFSVDLQYLHHSCAFNSDNKSYDAFGFQVKYKFWER